MDIAPIRGILSLDHTRPIQDHDAGANISLTVCANNLQSAFISNQVIYLPELSSREGTVRSLLRHLRDIRVYKAGLWGRTWMKHKGLDLGEDGPGNCLSLERMVSRKKYEQRGVTIDVLRSSHPQSRPILVQAITMQGQICP